MQETFFPLYSLLSQQTYNYVSKEFLPSHNRKKLSATIETRAISPETSCILHECPYSKMASDIANINLM